MEDPVRVLLADDHTMFREGLAKLLASYEGVEVVGQTPHDAEAVESVRREKPDVVIMEAQQPLERAKEILCGMLEVSPPPKVVICTMLDNPRYARALLGLGASAYLLKTGSAEQLVGAVRAAAAGPGRHAILNMPRVMLERVEREGSGILSERELEVLLLVTRGLANRQVASRLHLSESTVRRHLASVYGKMGVHSRTEAGREALSKGWITIQEITGSQEQGPA